MSEECVQPDYAYKFGVTAEHRFRAGLTAKVTTNDYGQGYISLGEYKIPINLAGKGKSKAMKKSRGILQWWIGQRDNRKYVHPQKRSSQRARKKLRNAPRRWHTAPSYPRTDSSLEATFTSLNAYAIHIRN